ncbi:MAG TPA: ATP phosphoribosyltransferase regulatory subunit [Cerasibacillus sp.]|uniref:ATP phosphoribosyltransferase regulatory subunit n=1 Tax=Cerasibacillus sp. TaxID=2498711 RepID=UPI002F411113
MYQSNLNDVLKANTLTCEKKENIIKTAEQLFHTYGYDEIETPIFEPYDLYFAVDGLIMQDDMVKVIGPSGKVLVLRPDVTIPVARLIAKHAKDNRQLERYFYIMDVFRHASDRVVAHKQIGVELFGDNSAEVDAEVLALAYDLLSNLQFTDFTIEVGHAGFVKQILEEITLTHDELKQLKQFIQAKNKADLQSFLSKHQVSKSLQHVILEIPDLYGPADKVIQRARTLSLNNAMNLAIDQLENIYQLLDLYGITEKIVLNLGLINQMDYYSDVIFQGFIANAGEPVLMGGRYDTLTEKFGVMMPAIGFGCDIHLMMGRLKMNRDVSKREEEIIVDYTPNRIKEAYQLMKLLRRQSKRVLMNHAPWEIDNNDPVHGIYLKEDQTIVFKEGAKKVFDNIEDVLAQFQ